MNQPYSTLIRSNVFLGPTLVYSDSKSNRLVLFSNTKREIMVDKNWKRKQKKRNNVRLRTTFFFTCAKLGSQYTCISSISRVAS